VKERIIAVYSLFLGTAILGLWTLILITGEIPEGQVEFTFHLFSEFLMAAGCLAAGTMLYKKKRSGTLVAIAAHAMVIYSVLNASGYYAERGEVAFPVLFLILMTLSSVILFVLIKPGGKS
jgi:hypothetical protein